MPDLLLSEEFIKRLDEHMVKEDEREATRERIRFKDSRSWHVGKEIPLAVLFAIATQTFGIIWWAATMSERMDRLKEVDAAASVMQTAVDRRQDEEAKMSESRIIAQLEKVDRKLDRLIEKR